jgi:hypothetical protein
MLPLDWHALVALEDGLVVVEDRKAEALAMELIAFLGSNSGHGENSIAIL